MDGVDPEHEALLADSVGLALFVVLETLSPAERLAFVLHDMFAVPFTEIATILGRSPDAARQLASRARRRVRGSTPPPDRDLARQRELVDAYLAAAREGDFDGLIAVLDPGVVLRSDGGPDHPDRTVELHGARAVAERAFQHRMLHPHARPVLVNGAPGAVVTIDGDPVAVLGFAVAAGRIAEIDILADPARLRQLDLTGLGG